MNKINIGKEIKISLLGIVGGTLILTVGEMILSPLPNKASFLEQNFPEEISLSGWQSSASELHQHFDKNKLQTIPGKSYRYTQNNSVVNTSMGYEKKVPRSLSVDIQMHYIPKGNNVKVLLEKYTVLPHETLKVLEQEEMGAYGILIHQNELHLSSCITPQGSSIVGNANFQQIYPAFQLLPDRVIFWLLGEKPLVENICLWSHLSMPIDDSSPEKAYLTLEKVWLSWYEHWYPYLVTTIGDR
ncbi:MAG: cyanoexosortase A system-associated protein [Xenococcaceae cyanobacterium MO_188.B29]|nr:cyanoexosortase A system-associated protein [Xenococcaceae cyanobacterium MO_188.B29]